MPKAKKFGTFSGVFTPSLLTILGVIMYMRLGWVVGQAGLIATIGIILIAHVISVTTGLSISSIATDKKIKTGGIYYMLSRTLGLPMGGAIGVALFLGTAMSISLYVIGFAESFLSLPVIADFFHLQQGVEGNRIIGTAIIIFLVIIAFISTSFAIKTQFIILAAVLLSLVSIFVGFYLHPEMHPVKPLLGIAHNGVSLELVFAIFFPAVTGFTAGVAMSGDLKDPKKNIPKGTILAIVTGFVVYMSLVVGFAFFTKRSDLINDTNIVLRIGWILPLILAGIWGATLSSALGGILGGPRILQALSQDKVMPKIFGKGYGASNEPRNALVLIFMIAEGGILVGELNLIAGVVTMFYLASYGFINLAYVLESWASTDFRPSFKVSIIFGIVGFIAAFVIMFKLDIISMIAAFAIIIGIYFILKRKQLKLEFGDVWQSVWNSVVRRGLQQLNAKSIEERNWQPNIILFSGESTHRPYLLELGKSLIGNFGMLSNIDLVEEKSAEILFPKYEQSKIVGDKFPGLFTRRQSCKNIYDGIEMIARTYGFSGIDPNTIIMGWARQSKDPKKFHHLLNSIINLDYNILLVDYDERFGFGKYKQIDIWWRGDGNNGNLAMTLVKFMVTSQFWENAKIRLMIVNFQNDKASYIYRKTDEILSSLRLDAEVKILNNQIEQKPVYDIIRIESKSADIVFVGIPEIKEENEHDFITKTNILLHEVGTVVLLKASSVFKNISLGINETQEAIIGETTMTMQKEFHLMESNHINVNQYLSVFIDEVTENFNNTFQNFLHHQSDTFIHFLETFKDTLLENWNTFKSNYEQIHSNRLSQFVIDQQLMLFNKLNGLYNQYKNKELKSLKILLETVFTEYGANYLKPWEKIPKKVKLKFVLTDFKPQDDESFGFRMFKKRKRLGKMKNDYIAVPFQLNRYLSNLQPELYGQFYKTIEKSGIETVAFLLRFQKFIRTLAFKYDNIRIHFADNQLNDNEIIDDEAFFFKEIDEINTMLVDFPKKITVHFGNTVVQKLNHQAGMLNELRNAYKFKQEKKINTRIRNLQSKIVEAGKTYFSNLSLFINANEAENYLLIYNSVINAELGEISRKTQNLLERELLVKIDSLSSQMQHYAEQEKYENIPFDKLISDEKTYIQRIDKFINVYTKRIKQLLRIIPAHITVMEESSYNDFFEKQFDEIKSVEVSFLQMMEFLTEDKMITSLNNFINEFKLSLNAHLNKLKENYRLYLFTFNEYLKKTGSKKTTHKKFLLELSQKFGKQKIDINQALSHLSNQISELKSEISGQMTLYGVTKFESQLKRYIHEQKGKEKITYLKRQSENIGNRFSSVIVRFKYGKTQAFAYAKNLQQDPVLPNINNQLVSITMHLQPRADILKKIPFYYKQLFSVHQIFHSDFWIRRKKEEETAQMIYKQYLSIKKGILLVTGEHHSGKSFLSFMLAHQWSNKVVFIHPPTGGTLDFKLFDATVAEAFQTETYSKSIFENLPYGSVVVFDDIELWWQRHNDGLLILKYISKLITEFQHRLFFILNLNLFAYRLLSKIFPIDKLAIGILKVEDLPVNVIKKMIMLRHNVSGFDFIYKNKHCNDLSHMKMADLFVQIYKFSNGNAGVALSAWLTSIIDYKEETLWIDPKTIPFTDIINQFEPDSKLILIQILIHKQITLEVLQKVTGINYQVLDQFIQYLLKMGVLKQIQNEVYEVNIFWYSVLVQYFTSKNLL